MPSMKVYLVAFALPLGVAQSSESEHLRHQADHDLNEGGHRLRQRGHPSQRHNIDRDGDTSSRSSLRATMLNNVDHAVRSPEASLRSRVERVRTLGIFIDEDGIGGGTDDQDYGYEYSYDDYAYDEYDQGYYDSLVDYYPPEPSDILADEQKLAEDMDLLLDEYNKGQFVPADPQDEYDDLTADDDGGIGNKTGDTFDQVDSPQEYYDDTTGQPAEEPFDRADPSQEYYDDTPLPPNGEPFERADPSQEYYDAPVQPTQDSFEPADPSEEYYDDTVGQGANSTGVPTSSPSEYYENYYPADSSSVGSDDGDSPLQGDSATTMDGQTLIDLVPPFDETQHESVSFGSDVVAITQTESMESSLENGDIYKVAPRSSPP